jgi:hypothetical protein
MVLPYMNITCNKLKDPRKYLDLMTREWVRLTLTNAGSLNGIFLAACRHLLQCQQQHQQQYYIHLAMQYKLLCVQALREAILSETLSQISDSTVTINILLAYDEVRRNEQGSLHNQTTDEFLETYSCSSVILPHLDATREA